MNTIYIKTTDDQIRYHSSPSRDKFVKQLAVSYDNSLPDILWKVESEGLSEEFLIEKFSVFGTVINKIDAYLLGKQLQPDRQIYDDILEQNIDFSFDNILPLTLDEAKKIKNLEIDLKSQSLISQGYEYQTGVVLSLSPNAQLNWHAMRTQRISGIYSGTGTVNITTIDDNEITINFSDIEDMTDNIFNKVKGIVDNGRTLKISVNSKNTIQDVSDVVDNR